MSPLLNNARVRAYISPEKITLVHLVGRWHTKIIEHCSLAVDRHDSFAGIHALNGWLTERALAVPVEVIVASHYCRFIILPWSNQLIDEQSRLNLAHVLLQRQYQPELAQDYEFSLDAVHFGQPQLATAMAKTWLATLVSSVAQTASRLTSVQPSVAVVWNRFYRETKTEWLMMIESDRQLYVQHQNGYIQQIEVRPHQAGLISHSKRALSVFNGQDTQIMQENIQSLQLRAYPVLADECAHSRYALCGVF